MRIGILLAFVVVSSVALIGSALAQNCPNGVCPVPTSRVTSPLPFTISTATTAAPTGVSIQWVEANARPTLFPRMAAIRESVRAMVRQKPMRRLFARLLWRF